MFYKSFLIFIVSMLLFSSFCYGYSEEDIIESIEKYDDTNLFNEVYTKIKNNDFSFDIKSLIKGCIDLFTKEVKNILSLLKYMMIIVFLNSFLSAFNVSFVSKGINNAVYLACYCFFIVLVSKAFSDAGEICVSLITKVIALIKASVPVCISLIASIGSISSQMMLKPLYLFFLGFISSFCINFFLPVINAFFALNTVGCMSNGFSVKNLSELLKKIIKWTMAGTVTLFIGSMSVMGLMTDKVIFKGTKGIKFALGNFVPVVGRMLSDTVETVTATAVLIKNSVGISGIIMISVICLPPVIKLVAITLSYKLCAALIEPVCDKRLSNMLSILSSSVELMLGICVTVGIVLAVSVSILINIGG